MKKLLLAAILVLSLSSPAYASYYYEECAPVAGGGEGPAFIPFALSIGLAAWVIYANAEGIPFPLCEESQCYQEYPDQVHHDGV